MLLLGFHSFQSHIFVDGTQALQHEFKSLLLRHGHPVRPANIVELLSSEEGSVPFTLDICFFSNLPLILHIITFTS